MRRYCVQSIRGQTTIQFSPVIIPSRWRFGVVHRIQYDWNVTIDYISVQCSSTAPTAARSRFDFNFTQWLYEKAWISSPANGGKVFIKGFCTTKSRSVSIDRRIQ